MEEILNAIQEIWKPIINYEGFYEVSNYGRIKSYRREGTCGGILNPGKNRNGYLRVCLSKNGIEQQIFVHRLVLEAFVGLCPPGMEGCHNNGNPSDNFVGNLRWDTSLANTKDAIRHGTKHILKVIKGSQHPMAKLNDWKIRIINRLLEDKYLTHKEIAKIFGVGRECITKINNKKRWKHISV